VAPESPADDALPFAAIAAGPSPESGLSPEGAAAGTQHELRMAVTGRPPVRPPASPRTRA